MKLFNNELIKYLPLKELIELHRTCCIIRGKGWNKPFRGFNYVFKYPIEKFVQYHILVIAELIKKDYNVDQEWLKVQYRGKILKMDSAISIQLFNVQTFIYPEHTPERRAKNIRWLKDRGIIINYVEENLAEGALADVTIN